MVRHKLYTINTGKPGTHLMYNHLLQHVEGFALQLELFQRETVCVQARMQILREAKA